MLLFVMSVQVLSAVSLGVLGQSFTDRKSIRSFSILFLLAIALQMVCARSGALKRYDKQDTKGAFVPVGLLLAATGLLVGWMFAIAIKHYDY